MNNNSGKFYLQCRKCGTTIKNFKEWFGYGQNCPDCGNVLADVIYEDGFNRLINQLQNSSLNPNNVWSYFDYLPLHDKNNIITNGDEGIKAIDRWSFLESFAKKRYNLNLKVYAHRHDQHLATGTFKDLAGTLVASVLKENGMKHFVAASTGNIGVAYARYLAAAGISLSLFIPETSLKAQEAQISSFGQNVYRVNGDYAYAKKMAKDFANKKNYPLTAGNLDPMRLEAKKTMVYEWLRLLPEFPTVFMQAISGGTGPLGISKAVKELEDFNVFEKAPRYILPQPARCAPMAEAWQKAKANNFPEGWEHDYPVYENPKTKIETLSTGNPKVYPTLAPLVKESGGDIISSEEEKTVDVSRIVAYESTVRMGPAASITAVGFFDALREGLLKDGDVVMLNIGEGTARSPQFMEQLSYSSQNISNLDEITDKKREDYSKQLWEAIDNM